jgi:hypothetical protein
MIPHTMLSVGGLYTTPVYISREMVGYHPTTTIIELRLFTGSLTASMHLVLFKYLLNGTTMIQSSIDIGVGNHLRASNIHITLSDLPIQ